MTACRQYELSVPPSANELFRNVPGEGRVKTRAYKQWLNAAGWEIACSGPRQRFGRNAVAVTIRANIKRNRDLDNIIKPTIDLLQSMEVIENDRWVDEIVAKRETASGIPFGEMSVLISAWEGNDEDRR